MHDLRDLKKIKGVRTQLRKLLDSTRNAPELAAHTWILSSFRVWLAETMRAFSPRSFLCRMLRRIPDFPTAGAEDEEEEEEEEDDEEEGVPRGTLLPPGSPCSVWPHTWWCFSQSLCWQKEPQYRAVLQPLHVSLALRPQFQQLYGNRVK